MVSEVLEEVGIDREKIRQLKRQALEGIIMVCQWQLDHMNQAPAPAPRGGRKGRRIPVE